jgi:hypothetical protein
LKEKENPQQVDMVAGNKRHNKNEDEGADKPAALKVAASEKKAESIPVVVSVCSLFFNMYFIANPNLSALL